MYIASNFSSSAVHRTPSNSWLKSLLWQKALKFCSLFQIGMSSVICPVMRDSEVSLLPPKHPTPSFLWNARKTPLVLAWMLALHKRVRLGREISRCFLQIGGRCLRCIFLVCR